MRILTNLSKAELDYLTNQPTAKAMIDKVKKEGIYIPEQVKGNIGLIFTGYINIAEDGLYSFYTYSDDGSYIRIDGQMVVDSDGPHSRVERSGQAALKKGLHEVEARYFDHSGGILEAGWIMPDGERRRFSSGDFFH